MHKAISRSVFDLGGPPAGLVRALAALLSAALLAACTLAGNAPQPKAALPSPKAYPALAEVVRLVVTYHVDGPDSQTILDRAARDLVAAVRRRTFTLGPVEIPAFAGDIDTDVAHARGLLEDLRRQAPSIAVEQLEDLLIEAVVKTLADCGTRYSHGDPPAPQPTGFSGIGVSLSSRTDADRLPRIRLVLPGGPAETAGIRDGDRIKSVNGRSVEGLSSQDLAAIVRGPDGSTVEIAAVGPSGDRSYRIRRAVIQVPPVVARTIEGRYGYMTPLPPFGAATPGEVRAALDRWTSAGVIGWVLDLRDIGGGEVAKGAETVSAFIGSGPLWLEASSGGIVRETVADGSAVAGQRPLAVLLGDGTDSLGLMIASALKERGRARLFGENVTGCTESGSPLVLPNGGTLNVSQHRSLSLRTREPIRSLAVDEQVRRGADGSDRVLEAALSWVRAQAP